MNRPECRSETNRKNGFPDGKQRYKCRDCGRGFTKSEKGRWPESVKRRAVQMYLEGLGFGAIERLPGASNATVMRWIRLFGGEAKRLRKENPPETSGDSAPDEVWHCVSKKNGNFGYGLLLTGEGAYLSTSNSEAGEAKPENGFGTG